MLYKLTFLMILCVRIPLGGWAPTIVLDAGHGGTDLGARRPSPYCEEKRIALQTARVVRRHLIQKGYQVIMTREGDAFLPLARRVEIANQKPAALFVSVHFNACPTPAAHGVEVYFYDSSKEKPRTRASKQLADSVLRRIVRHTSALSRGIKAGNLYVLRETQMPAILVEGGFISNPEERSLLKQRDYLEKIGRGIADGVHYYMNLSQ